MIRPEVFSLERKFLYFLQRMWMSFTERASMRKLVSQSFASVLILVRKSYRQTRLGLTGGTGISIISPRDEDTLSLVFLSLCPCLPHFLLCLITPSTLTSFHHHSIIYCLCFPFTCSDFCSFFTPLLFLLLTQDQ